MPARKSISTGKASACQEEVFDHSLTLLGSANFDSVLRSISKWRLSFTTMSCAQAEDILPMISATAADIAAGMVKTPGNKTLFWNRCCGFLRRCCKKGFRSQESAISSGGGIGVKYSGKRIQESGISFQESASEVKVC